MVAEDQGGVVLRVCVDFVTQGAKTDGTELGRVVCLPEDVVLKNIPA